MKNFLLWFILILSVSASAQSVKEFTLEYEGYNLHILNMAKDGKGNIVLVAKTWFKNDTTATAVEIQDANHDIDALGIILVTDEKFQVRKGWKYANFFPAKVTYDAAAEQFWVGGSEQEYNSMRPALFSHFQMVLMRVDIQKLTSKKYVVETEYACRMEDLVFHDKKLICTAVKDTLDGKHRLETAMVFELSASKFHIAQYQPYFESAEILGVETAAQSSGHVMLTPIDRAGDKLLFGATAFPFGHIPTQSTDLYTYGKKQLTSETFEPAAEHRTFYYVTNFAVLDDGNFLFAYVTSAESKFYMLEKTGRYLQTIWQKKVDDLQYPGFTNHVMEMPDGTIIAAAANKNKNWSCFVYSADGEMLRAIDTKQSIKSNISFMQPWSRNEFVCSFYSTEKKPIPNKILILKTE
jgi:hypothetical protein